MLSRAGATALWLTAVGLLGLLSGCGAQYRPVVTPINPTGPAPQDNNANFVVLSTDTSASTGLATLINGLGDTIMAQATLGNGVFSFALNSSGSGGYSLNSNGDTNVTLDAYPTSAPTSAATSFGLQTSHVTNSTLTPGSNPTGIFVGTSDIYLLEPYTPLSPTAPAAANAALAVLTLQAAPDHRRAGGHGACAAAGDSYRAESCAVCGNADVKPRLCHQPGPVGCDQRNRRSCGFADQCLQHARRLSPLRERSDRSKPR